MHIEEGSPEPIAMRRLEESTGNPILYATDVMVVREEPDWESIFIPVIVFIVGITLIIIYSTGLF